VISHRAADDPTTDNDNTGLVYDVHRASPDLCR
jgi:hypothetical protein